MGLAGRGLGLVLAGRMPETALKGTGAYGKGVYLLGNYFFGGVGHTSARYELIFQKGWKGLQAWVQERLDALDACNPAHLAKRQFYQAQLVCLDGIMAPQIHGNGRGRAVVVKNGTVCSAGTVRQYPGGLSPPGLK